jgi:hypothetical protein
MKKSIDQLLADLNGLVEQYGAMEAETTFASGDLVTYEGRNGTIESFDQDGNYAVRMMDDDMEATDEVVTLTAEQMQKYVKPEAKSDDDLIDEEEEEQEYKSGDFVSFVSQEGVTYGQIVETNENNYTIEVYTPVDSKYEATITPFPMNTEALIMSAKSRKIGYQAKRQAWQTIVHKEQTDAPDGNQLNEGDIRSLIEEVKTLIQNQ